MLVSGETLTLRPLGRRAVGLRVFFAVLVMGVVPCSAEVAESYRISGKVTSSGLGNLPGVGIRFGDGTAAQTDASGRFELIVPWASSFELAVTLEGFESKTVTVDATSGGVSEIVVELRPSQRIGERITVTARRELNMIQKEASVSLVERRALEQSHGLSAADAIESVPGVTIQRDQGEADEIFIRGSEPRMISTMVDGERLPSPDGDDRTAGVFYVPVQLIESIEVQTTFTPEMDADVIGGSINLLTRRTPPEGLSDVSFGLGYDDLSGGNLNEGSVTLGRRLLDARLGTLLSVSVDQGDRASERVDIDFDDRVPSQTELRHFLINRRRVGGLLRADYQPSGHTDLTAKIFHSEYVEHEQSMNVRFDAEEEAIDRQLREGRTEKTISSLDFAGAHFFPRPFRASFRLGYFEAEEKQPNRIDTGFVLEDVEFVERGIGIEPVEERIGDFVFDSIVVEDSIATDQNVLASLDLAAPFFSERRSSEFRAGLKFRRKAKNQDQTTTVFESEEEISLLEFIGPVIVPRSIAGQGGLGPSILPGSGRSILDQYGLEGERLLAQEVGDYDAVETSVAGYGLAEVDVSARSTLLAGLRYERTTSHYDGFELANVDELGDEAATLLPVRGDTDYDSLMPSALLVVEMEKGVTIKGGISRTFARPDYVHLVPFTKIDLDDLEIEQGNPDLRLTEAWNLDWSVDWERSSTMSLGVATYFKSIDDFIYDSRTETEFDEREFMLIRPENGDNARLYGIEAVMATRLGIWRTSSRLSLDVNLTWSESEASIPSRPGESLSLPGHADVSGSVSLQLQAGRAMIGLSGSYVGRQLLELGDSSSEDLWAHEHVRFDLFLTGRIATRWELYLRGNNLTNERVRLFEGESDRTASLEYSGWSGTLGFKFRSP